MQSLLGLIAVCVAVGAIALHLRARRKAARQPGATADNAIAIEDFGDIDSALALRRCRCRGRLRLRGEGPVQAAPRLRRVVAECRECGREQFLYFDVDRVFGN